jgi:hypothetical protein
MQGGVGKSLRENLARPRACPIAAFEQALRQYAKMALPRGFEPLLPA